MPTYAQFTELVRDWSNKDSSVLKDTRIQDCLRYAADKCYRNLRVAALENTITYNSTALTAATTSANTLLPSQTDLTLPSDLIEFIQIREIDSDGRTCRVFNEKTDLRTFNDWSSVKTSYIGYFSRQGNTLLLAPGFGQANSLSTADKIELHYYRRLPALNAVYDVTPANYAAGFTTQNNSGSTRLYFVNGDTNTAYATQAAAEAVSTGNVTAKLVSCGTGGVQDAIEVNTKVGTIATGMSLSGSGVDLNNGAQPVVSSITAQATTTATVRMNQIQAITPGTDLVFSQTNSLAYNGNEAANWLRDENERVLLMGALSEVFYYLQDDDQGIKYKKLFDQEIFELNDEDTKRNAAGGNVQVNFSGRGLI